VRIGIIDLEATSLDVNDALILEVGALVVDTDTWTIEDKVSALIKESDYPPIPQEIIGITGITQAELNKSGVPLEMANYGLSVSLATVNCFVAHNKDYDKPVLINNLKRRKLDPSLFETKPWICSVKDIKYKPKITCRKLSHLALDYGVRVDPSKLHRATDDCMLVVDLLKARGVDFSLDYDDFLAPKSTFRAHPKPPWEDGGADNKLVKEAGFRWEPVKKMWLADFKIGHQFELTGFPIEELSEKE